VFDSGSIRICADAIGPKMLRLLFRTKAQNRSVEVCSYAKLLSVTKDRYEVGGISPDLRDRLDEVQGMVKVDLLESTLECFNVIEREKCH
jgi:hypothetical protein